MVLNHLRIQKFSTSVLVKLGFGTAPLLTYNRWEIIGAINDQVAWTYPHGKVDKSQLFGYFCIKI